jgi:UPF0271 protein
VAAYDRSLPLLGLPGSALAHAARAAGLRFVSEAFADRGYLPNGRLVPRRDDGALVIDVASVAQRAVRFAIRGDVQATDGTTVPVNPQSLCLHGDTPGAVELATAVRQALLDAGVRLRAFTT